MEILNKTMIAVIIATVLLSVKVQAQDNNKLADAFSKSYEYENSGEYTKAINALKNEYDESSYEINLRLGWLNYMAGLFTESLAYYQKCIKLMPYAIEPKLGYVYPASALGNWDMVISQYKEILKIDPQQTLVNYRMGSIYYGKNDFKTAKTYLEKVVNLYPFDYDSVILLAWTNYKLGRNKEAKVLFNKALLIQPGDDSATKGLEMLQ